LPTDPLTGSRYPALGDAPNGPQAVQNAVTDLSDNCIGYFTSTTARNSGFATWVAGGGVMREGLYCHVNGIGMMTYTGTSWRVLTGLHALLHGSTTQSIPNNAYTAVTLGVQVRTVNMTTTTATGRINCTFDGVYMVSGQASFAANASGRRQVGIMKNGTVIVQTQNRSDPDSTNTLPVTTATYAVDLTAGDYLQLAAFQDSGGALNVDKSLSFLQATWIGP
jgi:hypothetical protein